MSKLRNAVIVGGALVLATFDTAGAAQNGFAAGATAAPRAAAAAPRVAPSFAPRSAPSFGPRASPSAAPRFTPAPSVRTFNPGIARPNLPAPNFNAGRVIRVPNGVTANRHLRGGAPYVPNAPQVIPKSPPAAALNRHDRRDHRGRRFVNRYPYGYSYGYPYLYGYGTGLAAPYVTGGYLADNGAYGVCFRLLQTFRETGAEKWKRRYDKCLAGDYSQLDYLD